MRFRAGIVRMSRLYLKKATPRSNQWTLAQKYISLVNTIIGSLIIKGMSYGPKRNG